MLGVLCESKHICKMGLSLWWAIKKRWLAEKGALCKQFSVFFVSFQHHKGLNMDSLLLPAWVGLQHLADCRTDMPTLPLRQRSRGRPSKQSDRHNNLFQFGPHPSFRWTSHSLIMIKTKTKSQVDTRGTQPSIHPLDSSSKSLPLPANENEFIVTYLLHWLCLLRREDTKLSSFEIDGHRGKTTSQQSLMDLQAVTPHQE